MTQIELRFYEAAVSFFTRRKSESEKRYEIAKAVYPELLRLYCGIRDSLSYGNISPAEQAATDAVAAADTLLEKLKK